ncbi:Wzz/FepE/Etk N-terminal domain-containing protein [Photobacterium phosphoreum]|uniref:Wzz/FepE/Etk N-terminal domain-containing protein n=1 Tax=Photobacterium phosphoreum TaxID=659 RepID=UPI0015E6B3D1|nr:Wzz/FepE/Etk N-terminal domain-containing protein [Photobacterium phosphoreum]
MFKIEFDMNDIKNNESPVDNKISTGVDVYDLFLKLWKDKITIICSVIVFFIASLIYVMNCSVWWSSKAIITNADYMTSIDIKNRISDLYLIMDSPSGNENLDKLSNNKSLFKQFVNDFSSIDNKIDFIKNNKEINSLRLLTKLTSPKEIMLFNEGWAARIKIYKIKDEYEVKIETNDSKLSQHLLSEYIKYINSIVNNNVINTFNLLRSYQYSYLNKKYNYLLNVAKDKIKSEISETKNSIKLAIASGTKKPILQFDNKQMFPFYSGSEALEKKYQILNNFNDFEIVEPKLLKIKNEIKLISSSNGYSKITFNTIKFVQKPTLSIHPEKPNKSIVIIFSILLGFFFGILVILIKFFLETLKTNNYNKGLK